MRRLLSGSSLDDHRPVPRRSLPALLGAVLAAVGAPAPAHAAPAPAPAVVPGEIIVSYEPSVDAGDRRDVRADVDASRPEAMLVPRTEVVRVDPAEDEFAVARRLERDPRVRYAVPNAILKAQVTSNDPLFTANPFDPTGQWHLARVSAPAAWDITTGSRNVVVAVVDSGMDTSHQDLAANLWTNPREVPNGLDDDDGGGMPDDLHGWDFVDGSGVIGSHESHGTHVAGLVGEVGNNALLGVGMAWQVSLMPVAFIDSSGTGTVQNAANSLAYATKKGADIVNGSFAISGVDPALLAPISNEIAKAPKVLFVFAAGNDSANVDTSPSYPCVLPFANVVCVGSTTQNDTVSSFSNYGQGVDLFAPGSAIKSTEPGGGMFTLSGTSMATPIVSGTAALMKSVSPWATPVDLADALRQGTDKIPSVQGLSASNGRLNAAAAVSLITDKEPPAPFSITSPAGPLVTKDRGLTIDWSPSSDAKSGLSKQIVTVDGREVETLDATATLARLPDPLGDGLHRITVIAEDRAGNRRESTEALVRIDYEAPRPASVVVPDPQPRRPAPFTITWASPVDDGGLSAQEVLVDGDVLERVGPEVTSATIGALPHGRHLISIRATDLVGNTSQSAGVPVNVDARPPKLELALVSSPSALARGRVTVRCRPSEEVRDCAVRVAIAGGRNLTRPIELSSSATRTVRLSKAARRAVTRASQGRRLRLVLTATATDVAGNTATKTMRVSRSGSAVRRASAR